MRDSAYHKRLKKKDNGYLPHNTVKLIQGGRHYFSLLEQLIDEAKEYIHLQTYIYDEDNTGKTVAEALIRAAFRGVKVYMLLDGYGSQHLSKEFKKKLKDAHVHLRMFQPLFKSKQFYLGRRLHHKVVVIDGSRCTVGGLNISDRYNDTPEASAWLDWVLYAEGEVAPLIQHICERRMRIKQKSKAVTGKDFFSGEHPVRVRVNDRLGRKREVYDTYLSMFQTCTSELIIMSAYFLPGREFRKNLFRASLRGVKIKVVLTGYADVFLIKYAERFIYRWLFRNKIRVFEYRKNVLHAKIAVCDKTWMTIGSYNINNLSAFASIEMNLDVRHPQFVTEVHQRLGHIMMTDCIEVTESKFISQFNYLSRLAHRFAYAVFRFLFFVSIRQKGDHW